MAYLTFFAKNFPQIHGKNPNIYGQFQGKLSFCQFWRKKKLELGQTPLPPWAKFPTFTENLFLGLPLMLCHTWSSQPPCLGLNLTTVPSPGPGCLTLPLWGNGSEQNINDQTSPVYMRSACPNVLINRLARSLAVVIWGETNPSTFAQIKPHPLTWCHSPALARVWNKCSMFKRGDQRTRCKRWPNWCHNHLKQAVRVVENT